MMQYDQQSNINEGRTLPDASTEPGISPRFTTPMAATYRPQDAWFERSLHGLGRAVDLTIRKIGQILGFVLGLLILSLIIRFILIFFGLTSSLFSQWIFTFTGYLMIPFDNIHAPIHYSGYLIDLSTVIAIIAYGVAILIICRFLQMLISRPSRIW
ncbi:hypothetical protein EPA93_29810 [Ktedonosporobacter rubrisoli]|uniref:YggT family protein n=1 Tax=Ktedonosporobacter rubrisoli TaxID=2509675 RepID=A0A4P6JX33_KTERU|nr:YggT family protein [Ktedonosporobacter rubrisoli]QBD79953.1 hypothetical protein EPA93_29810 [Ktedonosporobacter rubrisoli]